MQQRSFPEKPIGFSRGSVTLDICYGLLIECCIIHVLGLKDIEPSLNKLALSGVQ